ncbi:OmpA family protein [Massilia sp. PAMC28688]|uniref:OmpA family protein n=1 Tax=Massilia sp. PAMC28688 TaxID=2861283 RepID=UPI001E43487F|nr:OmpA family protein [Massilia sp. PAMC28688]
MKKIHQTVSAVVLSCCLASALAQDMVNPSWYLQPHVSVARPDPDFGVDERDYGAGMRLGKPVHQHWDMQVALSQLRAEDAGRRYHQTLLELDALLLVSRGHFRPFLLFGLGAQRDKVENPLRSVGRNSPFATAGLGFQWAMGDRWSMQADLRTVRGWLRDEELFGMSRSNNKYLSFGLNYALSPPPAPPAPPQPAPAPLPAAPVAETPPPPPPPAPPRFEKVTLSATELFAFDSASLSLPQPRLDAIAAALQADPGITDVDIIGYADRLGSADYNLRLSERRANAVRAYLIGRGVDGGRLQAHGRGEANPVVICDNKNRQELIQCLEPNRRVEVEQITVERRVP